MFQPERQIESSLRCWRPLLSLPEEFIGFIWCQCHSWEAVEWSTALQHTCLGVYLAISADMPWLASGTEGVRAVFFPGSVLSHWLCVSRKWSTGSTASGLPGSTTYRWPSRGPATRRWGGHGFCPRACCQGNQRWFCWKCDGLFKSPSLLKGHHTSDYEHAFISDSFFCFFLLQLVPKLTRNFMKEGFMEKTGPKVCTMVLLRGTFCN